MDPSLVRTEDYQFVLKLARINTSSLLESEQLLVSNIFCADLRIQGSLLGLGREHKREMEIQHFSHQHHPLTLCEKNNLDRQITLQWMSKKLVGSDLWL